MVHRSHGSVNIGTPFRVKMPVDVDNDLLLKSMLEDVDRVLAVAQWTVGDVARDILSGVQIDGEMNLLQSDIAMQLYSIIRQETVLAHYLATISVQQRLGKPLFRCAGHAMQTALEDVLKNKISSDQRDLNDFKYSTSNYRCAFGITCDSTGLPERAHKSLGLPSIWSEGNHLRTKSFEPQNRPRFEK